MKWISEEDLKKHIIRDNCDEGCGYIDERDIIDMEWVEDDKFIPLSVIGDVLDKIRAEIIELRSRQNVGVLECLDIIDKCRKGEINMLKVNWDEMDKQEIAKSVVLLDLFTKTYCRFQNDYERFDDLKFRCDECPFQKENGDCLVKLFQIKYAPHYRDFGSMGDL